MDGWLLAFQRGQNFGSILICYYEELSIGEAGQDVLHDELFLFFWTYPNFNKRKAVLGGF